MRAVALVPARAGSERVPGKNVAPLAGHPLIAYSIAAARDAGVFNDVVVSTDSEEIAAIARRYGAEVPGLRPAEIATSTSPDIEWVLHVLDMLEEQGRSYDLFSILRPTSPFRTGATIRRAWDQLLALGDRADSIRAVEPVRQHPGKMWLLDGELMRPLLPQSAEGTPTYSTQTKALPAVYAQNSSLEIAWLRAVRSVRPEIAGERIAPFLTEGHEGFSIDYPDDLERAESLAADGRATLPAATVVAQSVA
jgi:N-acylneuraminate cytidylyltransferase